MKQNISQNSNNNYNIKSYPILSNYHNPHINYSNCFPSIPKKLIIQDFNHKYLGTQSARSSLKKQQSLDDKSRVISKRQNSKLCSSKIKFKIPGICLNKSSDFNNKKYSVKKQKVDNQIACQNSDSIIQRLKKFKKSKFGKNKSDRSFQGNNDELVGDLNKNNQNLCFFSIKSDQILCQNKINQLNYLITSRPKFQKPDQINNDQINNDQINNDLVKSHQRHLIPYKKKLDHFEKFRPKKHILYQFNQQQENQPITRSDVRITGKIDNNPKNRINVTSSLLEKTISKKTFLNCRQIFMNGEFTKVKKSNFIIGKCLGEGKFGKVYQCIDKVTKSIYSLKEISKKFMKNQKISQQIVSQIKLQSFFNHPNIIKLYGFFADSFNIYLILEFMEGGTLFDSLKKSENCLAESEVSQRMREICNAIQYLHNLNIVHRDIKPQNILISNGVAKLCDFGWSTRIQDRRTTYCGTFDYASPQILQGKSYDSCVDLWSLGVLAFQLLTGKLPFYDVSRQETINNIVNLKEIDFPQTISSDAKDFIMNLLKKRPQERAKLNSLLNHRFLLKYVQDVF